MNARIPSSCLMTWLVAFTAGTAACIDYGVHDEDEEADERLVLEEVFTQFAEPAVDVLWVIDNTGSMAEEQAALAESFGAFAQGLVEQEVAYQLGVVTTDVSDDGAGVLHGLPWIITPQTADPEAAFTEAVQVGTDGQPPEAGFGAAWLALSEPLRSGANRGFRRDDALLHIVVVSDNDDESDELLGKDPAQHFLEFLEQEASAAGMEPMVSAVAGDVPDGCSGSSGRALAGTRYQQVVEATDGVFASICDADMDAVVQALGEMSLIYADSFELQAVPYTETLAVWVDDLRQEEGWSFDEQSNCVVFTQAPEPDATIRVRYTVLDEGEG